MSNPVLIEQLLAHSCEQFPDYPRQIAALSRFIQLSAKRIQEHGAATVQPWGLTFPEFNILIMLHGTEGHSMTPSSLASVCGEKGPNMTRLLGQLSARGLVSRSIGENDRRSIVVSLTDAGRTLLDDLLPYVSMRLRDAFSILSPGQARQLEQMLKMMLEHMAVAS
ncbi:MarR family transcriptional regulator [Pusillimonas sp. TS35]|uniref:MarR family winged helix-turn-helix transcriptional regulator n=1 Tax=Paracandidimonas lactea TaxID=2895524 RepID=UPI00137221D8|nr:MarR family transcriptional regulator [Paracandidimonas lactea]MYN14396.1 MarR family transcriptional regulator [Pusillimonas sp. TS35]